MQRNLLLSSLSLPLCVAVLAVIAGAQTGTVDQVSTVAPIPPGQTAGFNGDAPSLTWQAQVRAGLAGQLEGFVLTLTGPAGATLQTNVRLGGGWNTGPSAFTFLITKSTAALEQVFVDTTSANITLAVGALFVIEMQGTSTGCGINGSYMPPASGSPLYPEPLYLGGPGCFNDCGWRIGFTTYVLDSATTFCSGDGTGTACPCGNAGATGNGCASSVSPTGAHLGGVGVPSLSSDTFVLNGSSMPNSSALYFQGTTQTSAGAGAGFGDGLRCASGTIIRLGTKVNAGGISSYPTGTDVPISVRGVNISGGARTYQCWYRNAAAFCTTSTFNLTNGVSTTWQP
jgi:hypothetical protein